MKNKVLFILNNGFGNDIKVVADNLKDLEDYLINELGWYSFKTYESTGNVEIKIKSWFETETGTIEWIKCI